MKILGLDKLDRQLARMPAEARAEIAKALDKSADELEATMRALAPVDRGDLKGSIRQTPSGQELKRNVSAGTEETPAGPVEFGHSGQGENGGAAPVPFVWPSYRMVRTRVRGRINRAVRSSAKKAAGQ